MSVFLVVLRWAARLSGLLIAGGFALLAIGEMSSPGAAGPATLLEWAGMILVTVSCASLLIAWRWELVGSIVSLTCLAAFAILIPGGHAFHMVLLAMAAPGVLYVLDWAMSRQHGLAR
jgi:hypothetical protein